MKILITLLALAQIAIASTKAAVIYYPTNNGFEAPDVVSGGGANYGYFDQATSGWVLSYSGIVANGALEFENTTNGSSDGTTSAFGQAAYIGGTSGSAGYIRAGNLGTDADYPRSKGKKGSVMLVTNPADV